MAEGFQDALQLSGVWLPGSSFVAPQAVAGYLDIHSLSGVVLGGLGGTTGGQPEPTRRDTLGNVRGLTPIRGCLK